MPYRFRKDCPICNKPGLLYLSDHIRQVHNIHGDERKEWLAKAIYSPQGGHVPKVIPFHPKSVVQRKNVPKAKPIKCRPKTSKVKPSLNAIPYAEFKFRHKFSLLVVGPTQCGKTYFVQQILESNRIMYEETKPVRVFWFYNQWQERYSVLQESLGKRILFERGLPDVSDDLHEINPKYNNIIVMDDLMAEATDSPLVARLFTQGRHRNASVILLLQNMFPKGKYNTDISRNAQYLALFRSPSDRKQIGIVGERMFDKNREQFMSAYYRETEKSFGYIFVDNKPDTSADKQVLGDIFGNCHVYSFTQKELKKDPPTLGSIIEPPSRNQEKIIWSNAAIPVWQNYTNGAKICRSIPEGYEIIEMYKTSCNSHDPTHPGVYIDGENFWPVKIKNRSTGSCKWIHLHEDETTVRSFTEKCIDSEFIASLNN